MFKKVLAPLLIIVSGEVIFMLPFLIPRLYRPLMLEAWGVTNTEIGTAFSAYGIAAMFSYMIGGPFADKYHPRKLISISLITTSVGSIILLMFPSAPVLICTYFIFGISTILLMWGALIKVTHVTGGELKRSSAMGILDSGRGLTAALMSSALVFIVGLFYADAELAANKTNALSIIYYTVSGFTLFIGIAVWFGLKDFNETNNAGSSWSFEKAILSLKDIRVWLLGIVVLSAYCGYKSVDNYSIYLVDIQNVSLSKSSFFTSVIFWLRPLSALVAGLLADRYYLKNKDSRFFFLFGLLFLGSISQAFLALGWLTNFNLVFTVILFSAAFAYALRAIYFSIFGDLKINEALVGTTVGIVSFVGFLPDMFFGLVTGHLIDSNPGAQGYAYTFLFTAVFLLVGAISSLGLYFTKAQTR